jgi:integrase/recombinase XerD
VSAPTGDEDAGLPIEAEAFLTHLAVEKGRSVHTLSAYRRDLRRYDAFLRGRGRDLHSATPGDVDAFVTALRAEGLAPASTTRTLVAVRTMHRFLAAEGVLPADPAGDAEGPRRPSSLPKALSEAQVTALLDTVQEADEAALAAGHPDPVAVRDRAFLELLYSTGIRVSEACGLGFGDVDLDAALVRVFGKRAKERIVPLGRPAGRAMAEYLDRGRPALVPDRWAARDDADAVFLGVRGRRLARQAAWEVLQRRSREAGLAEAHISPHVLRHSCATHLLDHGADIRTVQELLGHASVSTTQIYTRVATERLFEAYRAAHPRSSATAADRPAVTA